MRRQSSRQRQRGLVEGYRSGLEEKVGRELANMGVPVRYEPFKIEYEEPAKRRKYTPDFVLPNGIIIETKGRLTAQDRAKHIQVKGQRPDLEIRFVFSNSRTKIYKGSPTSYGDWCDKHGFKYADKSVPSAWLKEGRR